MKVVLPAYQALCSAMQCATAHVSGAVNCVFKPVFDGQLEVPPNARAACRRSVHPLQVMRSSLAR